MKAYLKSTGQRLGVLLYDWLAIPAAFVGAFLIRFDFSIPRAEWELLKAALPMVFAIQCATFWAHGLYRNVWSYVGLRDLRWVFQGVVTAVALSVGGLFLQSGRLMGWPRSVFLLDAILLALILGGGRFAYRFMLETQILGRRQRRRVLFIGAGHTANLFAREFMSQAHLNIRIAGFLDDDRSLRGLRIHGAPILGSLEQLEGVLDRVRPDEVVIAIPSLVGGKVKAILQATQARQIACRICPAIRDAVSGRISLSQLREVKPEDVLRREVVNVDDSALSELIRGKSVLVTGAGGSIGSELCRQLLRYEPRTIVLFERAEFNLYRIDQELAPLVLEGGLKTRLVFAIGDILDRRRVNEVLEVHRPELVYHAAAYKHVPLMEENIGEALRNNVAGTEVIARASAEHGVKSFILVSTDKAVRPTSVMGASKRMAELVVRKVGLETGLKTAAVRFGNVLDSEGSVLPLFRKQIAAGGPVTITHPEINRFFMTIPEASLLVLQASALCEGGELYLLDMGQPVLIRQLAEDLISLAGLRPHIDIPIVYTGLRKGEKLYEELLIDGSGIQDTKHPKIKVSTAELEPTLPEGWRSRLVGFGAADGFHEDSELLRWIQEWVPEYRKPAMKAFSQEREVRPWVSNATS
jgi:FlaA1/EpsC-like NDP-sugar epimerase